MAPRRPQEGPRGSNMVPRGPQEGAAKTAKKDPTLSHHPQNPSPSNSPGAEADINAGRSPSFLDPMHRCPCYPVKWPNRDRTWPRTRPDSSDSHYGSGLRPYVCVFSCPAAASWFLTGPLGRWGVLVFGFWVSVYVWFSLFRQQLKIYIR